jgi:N-acetylglucosamine-6-phosphate deacetylase
MPSTAITDILRAMVVFTGADVVLPDGVRTSCALELDGERIVSIGRSEVGADSRVDLRRHTIAPGFIDVHVHGVEGFDTLDGPEALGRIARRLPKYGVTAFCPTTTACSPKALAELLETVARLRSGADSSAARVLPAHLESNFINAEYRGAQPAACLRAPLAARAPGQDFSAREILAEIDRAGSNVGILTLAPELHGAIELVRHFVSRGIRVSLGHSGATFDQALAAIEAGARHATHLFNRMAPLNHREPGLAGAVLASDNVAAEIICDGVHVHREMVRLAIAAKGVRQILAITDGVAVAGLEAGATATLGNRSIRSNGSAAYLEDGTLAGSVATMDRVFRFLVREVGIAVADAVQLCSTSPARALALPHQGYIAEGMLADLVVLDPDFQVVKTYIGGKVAYEK